jgi:GNAT superfamily N-acetyltransferase
MEMRRAKRGDIGSILALLADDDLQKLDPTVVTPAHEVAFASIDSDPNQFLAVAAEDGKIIGCVQLTFIPGLSRNGMWRCHIEGVRIERALRGKGLGAQMLNWAKHEARARHCGMIQLLMDKSRSDAHRFYEAQGLTASHQGFRQYF